MLNFQMVNVKNQEIKILLLKYNQMTIQNNTFELLNY